MDRYDKIERIGYGAYGTVYRARRRLDDLEVAMKVLDRTNHDVDVARFEREVHSQRRLSHPNVVRIFGQNLEVNPPWFVMEIADYNLREVLSNGAMSEEFTIEIFRQILAGVSHAHENGAFHRDLKPENVLIFPNEESIIAKIGDFGNIRNEPHDTLTLTGGSEHLGTLGYVAPEQLLSPHTADHRADIYTLGILLHEMLTGERPIPGISVDINRVDIKFRYTIQKCVESRKEERFQSVEELCKRFELAIGPSEMLNAPADTVKGILEAYLSRDSVGKAELLNELTRTLEANASDDELYREHIPTLPDYVVSDLINAHLASFERIIEIFDEHISGSLTFSYTDVVADFYERLFSLDIPLPLKRIILSRLVAMGVSHNRWYVMGVAVKLFQTIKDVAVAQVAAEVIENDHYIDNHHYSAETLKDRLLRGELHSIVRSALENLDLH